MNVLFSSVWQKKVWQMNKLAKDNCDYYFGWFYFGELQTIRQIREAFYLPNIPLYGIYFICILNSSKIGHKIYIYKGLSQLRSGFK